MVKYNSMVKYNLNSEILSSIEAISIKKGILCLKGKPIDEKVENMHIRVLLTLNLFTLDYNVYIYNNIVKSLKLVENFSELENALKKYQEVTNI